MKDREKFKKFWQQYQEISKLKETDFIEYIKKKEVLFIKDDMKKIREEKYDYSRLLKYYKRKLVDYEVMKEISGVKSERSYTSKDDIKKMYE